MINIVKLLNGLLILILGIEIMTYTFLWNTTPLAPLLAITAATLAALLIWQLQLLDRLNKQLKDTGIDEKWISDIKETFEKNRYADFFLNVGFVIRGVLLTISNLMQGNIGAAIFHILFTIIFIWIINKRNKSERDKVTRLIGEKSKALIDKITIPVPTSPLANPV